MTQERRRKLETIMRESDRLKRIALRADFSELGRLLRQAAREARMALIAELTPVLEPVPPDDPKVINLAARRMMRMRVAGGVH